MTDSDPSITGNPASETILVVEDDPAVRFVTSRALGRFGYSVLTAVSGAEALRILKEVGDAVDLVLTDIMMPDMNGVELSRLVHEAHPDIRVAFMSGYADEELLRQGLLAPKTQFIPKPFSPLELADRVRSILLNPPADDAGPEDPSPSPSR